MQRLRICQLITDLGVGGAERTVYELAHRLDKRRFDVQVAALRGGAVCEWLTDVGIRTTVLGVRGKWDGLKLRKLTRLLRREQIDILHTHLFHADLAGRIAARTAKVPHLVHTIHTAEARWRPWQFAFARLTSGACDRLIAVSPSARDHHARKSGLPLQEYVVIPNPLDAAAYAHDAKARGYLRKLWSVGEKDVLIAFVGRLAQEKGLETLLEAMRALAKRGKGPKLIIAGDGPKRPMVERFIAREPVGERIRLLGYVEDVRGPLSAADVFVAPSRWEGWSRAAAEAMACGLPVLAARVTGLCDLVVEGETGVMVEKDDAQGLADAIEGLVSDAMLRGRLGEAGRRRILEHFDIGASIAAHEQLYLEVAGR